MEGLLRNLLVLMALAGGPVLCQNVSPGFATGPQRPTTVATFTCPQEKGHFEAPGDCNRYYQCDANVATLVNCQPQLIFNQQLGFCDWPHKVNNPTCTGSASTLNQQATQICKSNPGNPTEAFVAGHPELCNAFYTCSTSYLYPACTFCGEGMYFSLESRACRDYASLGQDVATLCEGRQFVAHGDKVLRQLDGSCWPYTNIQNPFLALIDAIRNANTPAPPRTTG